MFNTIFFLKKMILQSVKQAARKKEIRVLEIGVEHMTFWCLVQMLYR